MYIHPGIKLGMKVKRKSYRSDVSDGEWTFCVRYLALMTKAAPQRVYPLREIFNGLRYQIRVRGAWRMMPHDLPPWGVVYQQSQRWIKAGCFEAIAHDLRAILRMALERKADPSAVILNSRTVQSTPESGARAGFDGHRKRKGSKVHAAVDTLGHLLALAVTPASE
jgi:transposase